MKRDKIVKMAALHASYIDHGSPTYRFVLDGRDDCRSSVFDGLDLRGAVFRDLDLTHSTFFETNLDTAAFYDCVLDKCWFNQASIEGTTFFRCSIKDVRGKILDENVTASLDEYLTAPASYGKIHYYRGS